MIWGNYRFADLGTGDESLPLGAAHRVFKRDKPAFPVTSDEALPMSEAKAASRHYFWCWMLSTVIGDESSPLDHVKETTRHFLLAWRLIAFLAASRVFGSFYSLGHYKSDHSPYLGHFCSSLHFFNSYETILLLSIVPCNNISNKSYANMLNNHRN